MNGQLVLFQWADCAVKKLGLEYFFRCAGIVTETALYILSKRCNFGKLEPVKDTVVLKKNKENHRYKHFLSSASAYYYPMILIPGIVYGYYAIFEMTSYSLISFSNNHPIISFAGVSKSTYPLNWKLSSWNRHFIVVSENNRFSQIWMYYFSTSTWEATKKRLKIKTIKLKSKEKLLIVQTSLWVVKQFRKILYDESVDGSALNFTFTKESKVPAHSFFDRILFSRAGLNILIFLPILGWIFLYYS